MAEMWILLSDSAQKSFVRNVVPAVQARLPAPTAQQFVGLWHQDLLSPPLLGFEYRGGYRAWKKALDVEPEVREEVTKKARTSSARTSPAQPDTSVDFGPWCLAAATVPTSDVVPDLAPETRRPQPPSALASASFRAPPSSSDEDTSSPPRAADTTSVARVKRILLREDLSCSGKVYHMSGLAVPFLARTGRPDERYTTVHALVTVFGWQKKEVTNRLDTHPWLARFAVPQQEWKRAGLLTQCRKVRAKRLSRQILRTHYTRDCCITVKPHEYVLANANIPRAPFDWSPSTTYIASPSCSSRAVRPNLHAALPRP